MLLFLIRGAKINCNKKELVTTLAPFYSLQWVNYGFYPSMVISNRLYLYNFYLFVLLYLLKNSSNVLRFGNISSNILYKVSVASYSPIA